jgi:hypothetical protein
VSWPDGQGNFKFAAVKGVNLSRTGLQVEAPEPIPVRAYVTVRSEQLKLACSASVRHCARCGGRFTVGLEFSHPLRPDHPALKASIAAPA